jgi:hypothetical protein
VTTTQTSFGAGFHGLTQSTTSFDGTTLTGSVNGRALVPESVNAPDASFPEFADNAPDPNVHVDANLETEASALLGHVQVDAMSLCPASASSAIASLITVLGAASSGTASSRGAAAGVVAAARSRLPAALVRPQAAPVAAGASRRH